jgi:hypothetical protein
VQSAFGLTEPAHAQLSQLKLHLLEMGPNCRRCRQALVPRVSALAWWAADGRP